MDTIIDTQISTYLKLFDKTYYAIARERQYRIIIGLT
jgi:hypothetical protein